MEAVHPSGGPALSDSGPLVAVADLAARLGDDTVRIADCRWYLGEPERGCAAYRAGHIPGAVYVDLERHLSAPSGPGRHPLPDPATLAAAMGELGIGDSHDVVAYDDRGGAVAARLWWLLRHMGHARVRVLDGGLTAWRAAGQPVTSQVAAHPPATLTVRPRPDEIIERSELRAALGDVVLVDARSGERYRGEDEPVDPVAGHIPTAVSAPYEANLDADLRFLPAADLRARYATLGVGGDREVVAYCGSGVTACHDLLAMAVAGFGGARLYPGSWSDWAAVGYPVATGPAPGEAP